MLVAYTLENKVLQRRAVNLLAELTPEVRWLDLNNPTEQERQWVQQAYGQDLLFMEELGEIEASARFYRDEHGLHVHLYFLRIDDGHARNVNVAFTLKDDRLYTLHSDDLPELRIYLAQAARAPKLCESAVAILLGIVSVRISLMADVYERLQADLEPLSNAILRADHFSMQHVLTTLARVEDTNSKARLGLLENKSAFSDVSRAMDLSVHAETLNELVRDAESLVTHSSFLAERTKFLMDTSIGMINMAHSRRLNIFTVLSVVLMPPTLIASIYGMNFEHMPELRWLLGYPFALALMAAAAVLPILYLRRKEWL